MQIHGGRLLGKTYLLRYFLQEKANFFKREKIQSIIVQFDCCENLSIAEKFKALVKKLQSMKFITEDEKKEIVGSHDTDISLGLAKVLQKKKIKTVFGFDHVSLDSEKQLISKMLDFVCRPDESIVQILVATESKDSFGFSCENSIRDVEAKGFSEKESLSYLSSKKMADEVYMAYQVDDNRFVNIVCEDKAKELADFFSNNPGCLRLAEIYCITRRVTYKQLMDCLEHEAPRRLVFCYLYSVAQKINQKYADAFRYLHGVCDENKLNLNEVSEVLAMISEKDVPVHLIGKICHELRKNAKRFDSKINFHINLLEASEVVYQLKKSGSLIGDPSTNYPNGTVSFRKHIHGTKFHDPAKDKAKYLKIALESLVKMISKDNTERRADIRLQYLKSHVAAFSSHVKDYLEESFKISDKRKETFVFAMVVSRLYELLGQGIVQERSQDWDEIPASNVLNDAALLIWDVCVSYQKSFFSFCFSNKISSESLLNYDSNNDPEELAKKIASKCVEAGKNVSGDFIEEYLMTSLVLNKLNLTHFIRKAMKHCDLCEQEACQKLKDIETLVKHDMPCEKRHLTVLRETGNLLSTKDLQSSFFGQRLSSIYHTFGRQVLYMQEDMSIVDQKKCEYYTKLSHFIAKEIRIQTGVCLLNEYITVANCEVPRLLHSRRGETKDDAFERIRLAHERSKELLEAEENYYEDGCFRLVKDTDYTKINAYKYMVKSNTKMLKVQSEKGLPDSAWDECKTMLNLARKNSFLDMAPHVFIQGAKFYAATGRFKEAFETFSEGFDLKKNGQASGEGVLHLMQWRPKSFAWAVNNLCLAVRAYSKQEKNELKYLEKKKLAIDRCKQVLGLGKNEIGSDWFDRFNEWLKIFEGSQ